MDTEHRVAMKNTPESEIIHQTIDTDAEEPGVQVVEAVADIEGKESTDLTTTYECIDGVLNNIFSNPPSPDAQMQVTFSYEGYRITIEQNGGAKFVKIE